MTGIYNDDKRDQDFEEPFTQECCADPGYGRQSE